MKQDFPKRLEQLERISAAAQASQDYARLVQESVAMLHQLLEESRIKQQPGESVAARGISGPQLRDLMAAIAYGH